ncbi:MAG: amidohydrolase [Deltaproteobacteria bacterium]|nr:amidohydrolase [Deltaproteobacteria bacterium]
MSRISLVFFCLSTFASASLWGSSLEQIQKEVDRLAPEIIELRHHIHQYPELGNREFETAKLVVRHLEKLGFEDIRTGVAHTGVVAVLEGGKPGPTVAVRADMDALPVTEATELPFKSTVRTEYLGQDTGVSHACGHDIHTSVQLGVASVLASMKKDLPGRVVFLFQPAEEGPPPGEEGGADLMLEEGAFAIRPEAVFGLHALSSLEVGTLGYTSGPAFAAVDHFLIDIHGAQSHGAAPHQGVDPVVMSAQAIMALQTIRSRNLDPLEPSVVTVGIVRGGTRFNIIPATVHLEGTVRTYNPEVRDTVERRMEEILNGITQAGGGRFDLDYQRGTPATINDPALTEQMMPTLSRVVGKDNIRVLPPTMGGEDFAYFANEVPGFYFRLGAVRPGTTSGGHHTPTFTADDGAVPVGMRAMSQVILDYLHAASDR